MIYWKFFIEYCVKTYSVILFISKKPTNFQKTNFIKKHKKFRMYSQMALGFFAVGQFTVKKNLT